MTREERIVLGVLVTGQAQSVRELHATIEQRYGELCQLNVFEVRAILNRLEERGLIASFER